MSVYYYPSVDCTNSDFWSFGNLGDCDFELGMFSSEPMDGLTTYNILLKDGHIKNAIEKIAPTVIIPTIYRSRRDDGQSSNIAALLTILETIYKSNLPNLLNHHAKVWCTGVVNSSGIMKSFDENGEFNHKIEMFLKSEDNILICPANNVYPELITAGFNCLRIQFISSLELSLETCLDTDQFDKFVIMIPATEEGLIKLVSWLFNDYKLAVSVASSKGEMLQHAIYASKNKLQYFAVTFTFIFNVIIGIYTPGNIKAQIAGCAIGLAIFLFAQLPLLLPKIPEKDRVKLISIILTLFLVFLSSLVYATARFIINWSGTVTSAKIGKSGYSVEHTDVKGTMPFNVISQMVKVKKGIQYKFKLGKFWSSYAKKAKIFIHQEGGGNISESHEISISTKPQDYEVIFKNISQTTDRAMLRVETGVITNGKIEFESSEFTPYNTNYNTDNLSLKYKVNKGGIYQVNLKGIYSTPPQLKLKIFISEYKEDWLDFRIYSEVHNITLSSEAKDYTLLFKNISENDDNARLVLQPEGEGKYNLGDSVTIKYLGNN